MKKRRYYASLAIVFSMILQLIVVPIGTFAASTIDGITSVSYSETAGTPVQIASSITIQDETGFDYKSYIQFEVTDAKETETLDVIRVQDAADIAIEAGEVSIYGNVVYIGTGAGYEAIASIDSQYDGQQGNKLRISFSRELENANFLEGAVNVNFDDADVENPSNMLPGWSVEHGTFNLTEAGLNERSLGRPITVTGTGPYTVTGPDDEYTYTTMFNYGVGNSAWLFESVERPLNDYLQTFVSIVTNEGGTGGRALQLQSAGSVVSNNGSPPKYGSHFGPVVKSAPFRAKAGDTLSLDWKARYSSDHYEVYGFARNIDTDEYHLLFYGRGEDQDWTTSTGTIPSDGDYQFVFVNGTYDKTGGYAVGSLMWIDNIKVYGETYQDEVAQNIARLVTYQSDDKDPGDTREIAITVVNKNEEASSASITIDIENQYSHAPEITALPNHPAANNSGSYSDLFGNVIADSIEASDLFRELQFTVSGLKDGESEVIIIDGTDVALIDGNEGTTSGNVHYTVSETSGTATVIVTHSGLTNVEMSQLIDRLAYKNASLTLTEGMRSVTLTYVQDSGRSDPSSRDENEKTLNITSIVTVTDVVGPKDFEIVMDDEVHAINQHAWTIMIMDGEAGADYTYTISSSEGGTPVTGSGKITGSEVQIDDIDLSGLVDGTLTATILLTDSNGNSSAPYIVTLLKDTEAPQIKSIDRSTLDWTSEAVTITAALEDSGSGIAVKKYAAGRQDAAYFAENGQNISVDSFQLIENGVYTLYVEDELGNYSIQTFTITNIDNVKPPAPAVIKLPDTSFYNADMMIEIVPSEDVHSGTANTYYRTVTQSVYDAVYDSGWLVYDQPLIITMEGTTEIFTKTEDAAGNFSDVVSETIAINRNLTVSAHVAVEPNLKYSNEDFLFTITKQDINPSVTESVYAEVYYKVTGMDDFNLYVAPFTVSEEGEQTVTILVKDRYGNETTVTKTVTLDKTAPDNQDTLLPETVQVAKRNDQFITIQLSEAEDTIWLAPAGTKEFVEGSTMTKAAGDRGQIAVPEADGEYVLYVVDHVGNVSEASEAKVIVDRTAPQVEGVVDGETYKTYPAVSFSDGTALLNGEPFNNGDEVKENGKYTLTVTDDFGNVTTITFTVDNDVETVTEDRQFVGITFAAGNDESRVTASIELPVQGLQGSDITWISSHPHILSNSGEIVSYPEQNTKVTLTAIITKGEATVEKQFEIVVYADAKAPVITLLGDAVTVLTEGELFVEKGFKAIDDTDGDVTNDVVREGYLNTKQAGTYPLIYTVVDQSGNKAQVVRTVIVTKKAAPAGTIIHADNNEAVEDDRMQNAIDAAAASQYGHITIKVNESVTTDSPLQTNMSKEMVDHAKANNLKLIFETENASIIVPLHAVNTTDRGTNASLQIVIEQIDPEQEENRELVDAVKQINDSIAIYNGSVYDFKLKWIEKDENGSVIKEEVVENFTSDEEIELTMYIGKGKNKETSFMTFYFNEVTKEWEYVRGFYNETSGVMTLYTNHLSIYAVMNMTLEEKLEELTKLINAKNITVEEVLYLIEDEDVIFDQKINYLQFSPSHKTQVGEDIIAKRPAGDGYADYDALKTQLNESVWSIYDTIFGDLEAPVITLNGKQRMNLMRGEFYIEQGALAADNVEGDVTGKIIVYGEVNTDQPGVYEIVYTIKDLAGNESSVTREVHVIRPIIGLPEHDGSDRGRGDTVQPQEPTEPSEPEQSTDPDESETPAEPDPTEQDIEIVEGVERIQVTVVENADLASIEDSMTFVSRVFGISPAANGEANGIVKITYNGSLVTDENKIGIFMYDDALKTWRYVGGVVNKGANEITLNVEKSGIFAVIENNVTFRDIEGHWAQYVIEQLASKQIISGDPSGNYHPNMGITRAEFATIITKAIGLEVGGSETGFDDIAATSWYAPYIAAAREAEIVYGISEKLYDPDRVVNRQEMTAMVIRAFEKMNVSAIDLNMENLESFADDEHIAGWAKDDVYAAKQLGIVEGRGQGKFSPIDETLRGEAAMLIYNLLTALGKL